jgi:hypothetical protein
MVKEAVFQIGTVNVMFSPFAESCKVPELLKIESLVPEMLELLNVFPSNELIKHANEGERERERERVRVRQRDRKIPRLENRVPLSKET